MSRSSHGSRINPGQTETSGCSAFPGEGSRPYEADDAHPETCSVHGEAESVFALRGHTLTWRGHLLVTTDEKNFYYQYTRELLKDGQMYRSRSWQETIPREYQ